MRKDAKRVIMARADLYMIIARKLRDGEETHMNVTLEFAKRMVDEYLCLMQNCRIDLQKDFFAIDEYCRDYCFFKGDPYCTWKDGKIKEYKNYQEWEKEGAA